MAFLADSKLPLELAERFQASDKTRLELSAFQTWIQSFADRGLFQPLDRLALDHAILYKKIDRFIIPTSKPVPSGYAQIVAQLAAPYADRLFVRESWPWTVWRETSFAFAGQGQYIDVELNRILAPGTCGPIGHWLLAELLSRIG